MEQGVRDTVVIVTGGARGIGRSLVLGLLAGGARVAVVDRLGEELSGVAEEAASIADRGSFEAIRADVSQEKEAKRIVERTVAVFGRLDALVNNAGVGRHIVRGDFLKKPLKFWEVEPEHWRQFFNVNTNGFYFMTRAALGPLLAQRHGRIVTVTTNLATMIRGGSVGYGASKAATEASMATLARDLVGTGVTANVLIPGGPVDTPGMPDIGVDRAAYIQPEAMVPPLKWLLSEAAEGVNGRRFVAVKWDPSLAWEAASAASGDPIGWPQLGMQTKLPEGVHLES